MVAWCWVWELPKDTWVYEAFPFGPCEPYLSRNVLVSLPLLARTWNRALYEPFLFLGYTISTLRLGGAIIVDRFRYSVMVCHGTIVLSGFLLPSTFGTSARNHRSSNGQVQVSKALSQKDRVRLPEKICFRRQVAQLSDKRIGIMNEILNGIRVIKMYAWEQPFSNLVDKARM